jgi:hypothetical protein
MLFEKLQRERISFGHLSYNVQDDPMENSYMRLRNEGGAPQMKRDLCSV